VSYTSLLSLGTGKIGNTFRDITSDFDCVVCVDRSYATGVNSTVREAEESYTRNMNDNTPCRIYVGTDLFEFLDTYKYQFDKLIADRIFEHQFYDSGEIGRLLDACNQITNDDAELVILVPDALKLSEILIDFEKRYEEMTSEKVESTKLLLNTEFNNTMSDPHGSQWTPKLAHSYIASEGGTWKIDKIEHDVIHKGRNIYMRIFCSKP
jgi:hypothetical protein